MLERLGLLSILLLATLAAAAYPIPVVVTPLLPLEMLAGYSP